MGTPLNLDACQGDSGDDPQLTEIKFPLFGFLKKGPKLDSRKILIKFFILHTRLYRQRFRLIACRRICGSTVLNL